MGRAPYKLVKERNGGRRGGWPLFEVFLAFNHVKVPMYAYSNSMPSNLLKYLTNNNVQKNCQLWKFKFRQHATLNGNMPP